MIVAFFDLLEAEGRSFRRNVVRVGYCVALVAVTAFLVFLALGLWVWATYEFVAAQAGSSAAGAFAAGVVAMVEAGIGVWIIEKLRR